MTFTTRVGLASLLSLSVAAFACTSEVAERPGHAEHVHDGWRSTTSTGGTGSMLPARPDRPKLPRQPCARPHAAAASTGTEYNHTSKTFSRHHVAGHNSRRPKSRPVF